MSTTAFNDRIAASKMELRKKLSRLPIGEKLRILDTLRQRDLAIRSARPNGPGRDSSASDRRSSSR